MSDERRQPDEQLSQLFQSLRAERIQMPLRDALFGSGGRAAPAGAGVRRGAAGAAVLLATLVTGAAFGSGVVRLPCWSRTRMPL